MIPVESVHEIRLVLGRGIQQGRLHGALAYKLPLPAGGAPVLEPGVRVAECDAIHGLEI